MPITDPAAVKFCNEQARIMADCMAQNYYTAKVIVNNWNALGMSSLVTNDASVVVDGSATDGRNQVTGAKITSIITRAMEIIADYEASSNAKLNTVLQVRVNGTAKF